MGKTIVKIIVNKQSKQVDKAYDYAVKTDLFEGDNSDGDNLVGRRVQVPFGRGNTLVEGYIVGLADNSNAKLKYVSRILDKTPVLSQEDIRLAEFIKSDYHTTFLDAIRLITPHPNALKSEIWVEIVPCASKEDIETICKNSKTRGAIIKLLGSQSGRLTLDYLEQSFESSIKAQLKALEDNGIIKITQIDIKVNVDKLVKIAYLNITGEEAGDLAAEIITKAPLQAAIISLLEPVDYMLVSDILSITSASHSAIKSLEKKGIISVEDMVIRRDPLKHKTANIIGSNTPNLTPEQIIAVDAVTNSIEEGKQDTFLLHGVTGSGKTEVFMSSIEKVLEENKSALVMVSEISLTPQLTQRFLDRFGDKIAIIHSKLSQGERYDEYKRIKSGEAQIVIGARSAGFAPLKNIGIIIMDEEHETSYKSEQVPRYHAREIALFRAKENNSVVIFASATPSVISYYKAKMGEYKLLTLKKRFNNNPMPPVRVVDMRQELKDGNKSIFSAELFSAMKENLSKGEQTILFINHRGFSSFVSCRSCGYVCKCSDCSVSMTYHKAQNSMICHYCGKTLPVPNMCPKCGSPYIRHFGIGTQKVEQEIKKAFPNAKVLRMDADTTRLKNGHEHILEQFEKEKIDILIGTQMVSKGLDFENVTLVGVIAADIGLNSDDFRAGERGFDNLTQVCGRSGRGDKAGRAVIQSYDPSHYAITSAQKHDYVGFFNTEIRLRKQLCYPPFCHMVQITVSAQQESLVKQHIREILREFKQTIAEEGLDNEVLKIIGPTPSYISKIKKKYRWQLMIKCRDKCKISHVLESLRQYHICSKFSSQLSFVIDKL